MIEQLKSCPKCNQQAVITEFYHRGNYYLKVLCSHECSNQEWLVDPDFIDITKKIATEDWNKQV